MQGNTHGEKLVHASNELVCPPGPAPTELVCLAGDCLVLAKEEPLVRMQGY